MIYLIATGVLMFLVVALAGMLTIAERLLVNYGVCTIDLNRGERTLKVDGGRTLLAALYDNKVFIPSACGGKGSCGHCKVTVIDGGGPLLPTETPYLTRSEIKASMRLACQVKVRRDMIVRIPEELLNVKLFTAAVLSTRSLTYDIKEIVFELIEPQEISQRPGQYVQIEIPSADGPLFRAYSISSPDYEPRRIELNVRLVPDGVGSTYLHNLEVGDRVTLTGPYGEFRLNEDPRTEIVCVGGGCGMAPMKNIIYSLYRRFPERRCRLFFGCRTTQDVFYLDEFRQLAERHPNFSVVYALSDLPADGGEQWNGETGFIHLAVNKHLEPDIPRQAFLCGPPPMIDAVTAVLHEKGLRDTDIFYDKF